MSKLISDAEYKSWVCALKDSVKKSQIKASLTINKEILLLYLNLGLQILEKQKNSQ